jgi:hypothetical protein
MAKPRRRFARRFGDALSFVLLTVGAVTLILLAALGGYLAWTLRLRDLWTQVLHQPPPF